MTATRIARVRFAGAFLALVAAIVIAGLLARSDSAFAQVAFNPSGSICVVDSASDQDCNTTTGANADQLIRAKFCIGYDADCAAPSGSPDINFGAVVNFTPPEWGVYKDADVPDGAVVAQLKSSATLGLIGAQCSTGVPVTFDMLDATTNAATTVTFRDPESDVEPTGDTNDSQGSEPDDQFDIGPDGLPLGVTRYPDYLTRIFEGLTPRTRLYGQTEVAGIEVSLNFVLFERGIVWNTPSGDQIKTDPRMGYPSATVLQSAGDPATEADTGENNAVSDFCSPLLASTEIYAVARDNPDTPADERGGVVRTTPPDGVYNFTTYTVSQRDADGDGIETSLDPCPTVANPTWNPRIAPADAGYTDDADKDSLPDDAGCDPDPTTPGPISGGAYDQDNDQYVNRADNCSLVPNSKGQVPGGTGADNQEDSDSDGIGDQCDSNPTTPDGDRTAICLISPITVGAGGAAPVDPRTMQPCDPNAVIGAGETPGAGQTPTPGANNAGNGDSGPTTGVGALAPAAGSIPAWASALSALGGAGLLGSLGAFAARVLRRRRD